MKVSKIPFQSISALSKKDIAYATGDERYRPFYEHPPTIDGFKSAIEIKKNQSINRKLLVEVLEEQYSNRVLTNLQKNNLSLLKKETSYTVITAHQPSLFTGPLYYIYKIFSAINLAERLNTAFPNYQIVPVFVSGGEDHDFEEINHVHLFNKTITWETESQGAVGDLSCGTLQSSIENLFELLGTSENATSLKDLIKKAYSVDNLYGQAALDFTNELFKQYGILVFSMNNHKLKKAFSPIIKQEIFTQPSQGLIEKTQEAIQAQGFKPQAHAREINFFYLFNNQRNRIVLEKNQYKVLGTEISFSESSLTKTIDEFPDRFSPNVVMRPLFQEFIMPNLAYIGGGGEIAYWLERKSQFRHFGIPYPILVRRNSVLWIERGIQKKITKLGLTAQNLFEPTEALIKLYLNKQSDQELNLTAEKKDFQKLAARFIQKAGDVDVSTGKKIAAEATKITKEINKIESWIIRAAKQKNEVSLNQITNLKSKLFPKGLQERYDNFMPFYLKYGAQYFDILKKNLNPLEHGFIVIQDE